jgi:hypothetical protein
VTACRSDKGSDVSAEPESSQAVTVTCGAFPGADAGADRRRISKGAGLNITNFPSEPISYR